MNQNLCDAANDANRLIDDFKKNVIVVEQRFNNGMYKKQRSCTATGGNMCLIYYKKKLFRARISRFFVIFSVHCSKVIF